MNRRSHQHSLAHLARKLENGVGHMASRLLVQQAVFALSGRDVNLPGAHHVVERVGVNSRRIDHVFGRHNRSLAVPAVLRLQLISTGSPADALYFGQETEFHAIVAGVLRQGDGQAEGAHDAAAGRVQGRHHAVRHIRLHLPGLVPADNGQAGNAVLAPLLIQLLQPRFLLLVKAEHQGTVPLEIEIQLPGQFLHHAISLHIEPCLERSRNRVVACVHNGAVRLGSAGADVLLPLHDAGAQVIAGQFPGNGTSDHAAANDHRIEIHFSHDVSLHLLHSAAPFKTASVMKKE